MYSSFCRSEVAPDTKSNFHSVVRRVELMLECPLSTPSLHQALTFAFNPKRASPYRSFDRMPTFVASRAAVRAKWLFRLVFALLSVIEMGSAGALMTLQGRVRTFVLKRAPRPVCDECVADHLALSRRQVVTASRFIVDGEVRRFTGRCSGCCTNRKVTVRTES